VPQVAQQAAAVQVALGGTCGSPTSIASAVVSADAGEAVSAENTQL